MSRIALLLSVLVGVGCGDNTIPPGAGIDAPGTGDDVAPEKFTTLASFDPAMGQNPEGVVSIDGVPLVGLAPLGQIVRVPAGGAPEPFGNLPAPVANTFTLGLAANAAGEIFVGVGASGAAPTPAPGVYKIPAAGGEATLFADALNLQFPNALDFDGSDLYVTDSAAGRVFKITAAGMVSNWSMNAMLQGDQDACGGSGAGFNIGANGIAHDAGFRYVAVTDHGRLLRIPILQNGNSGVPEVVAESCDELSGIDGIALDTDGSIIAVRNGPSLELLRIAMDGTITVLHQGAPLDGPASVVIDAPGGVKRALITNSAFFSGATGSPSLVSLAL
jgi:hypothetical protein